LTGEAQEAGITSLARAEDDSDDAKLASGSLSTQKKLLAAAGTKRSDGVVLFWKDTQDNGYLSNWGKSRLQIDGITYNCVEQWIMASKARACGNQAVYTQVMATSNPRKQKGLGRSLDKKVVSRCWKVQQKWEVQLRGARAKFQQNENLAVKLLSTGQKPLAEASPSDQIYGIGIAPDNPLAQDPVNWKGMNLLGKALEQVREEIRKHVLAGMELSSMTLASDGELSALHADECDLPSSEPESLSADGSS
jgi:hypothetical protein